MPITTSRDITLTRVLRRVWAYAHFATDPSGIANLPMCLNAGTFPGEYIRGMSADGNSVVDMIGVNGSNQVVLPNGAVTGNGSIGLQAVVNLTTAQIQTLHSAPVTLVAAPGAGKAIAVEQLVFEMTTTSTAFTGGGAVGPVYHGATGTFITANTIPASVVTAAAGTSYTMLARGAVANGLTLAANTAVDLFAATADFAAGTGGSAKVIVYYQIVTL